MKTFPEARARDRQEPLSGRRQQDDVKCTWAGPWPPAASHTHLGRTEPGCPAKVQNGQNKGAQLPNRTCSYTRFASLFLEPSEGRGHAAVGVPCPSKRVGRGHSQGTRQGRRERAAVCPGAEQTLEPLSWGSGGGRWPDGEQPRERRDSWLSNQPLVRPLPQLLGQLEEDRSLKEAR